jgi:hypothetical protein
MAPTGRIESFASPGRHRTRNHQPAFLLPNRARRYGISFRSAARRGPDRLLLGSIEQVGAALLSTAGARQLHSFQLVIGTPPCNRVHTCYVTSRN